MCTFSRFVKNIIICIHIMDLSDEIIVINCYIHYDCLILTKIYFINIFMRYHVSESYDNNVFAFNSTGTNLLTFNLINIKLFHAIYFN